MVCIGNNHLNNRRLTEYAIAYFSNFSLGYYGTVRITMAVRFSGKPDAIYTTLNIMPYRILGQFPWRGIPYTKYGGARPKFWRERLGIILSCGRGLKLFHPVLKHNIISCHTFSAQYRYRYRKSFYCGPFEAEHPKRYQNRFFFGRFLGRPNFWFSSFY